MDEAIKFDNVVADELLKEVSFVVPGGSLGALITSRQEENDLQIRLMLGLTKPAAGSVMVLGEEVGTASEKMLNSLRKRVAVVFPTGGLVSNLKVWENLVLPLEYHALYPQQEIDDKGMAALHRVGYAGGLMELPGHLSLYEKRQIGLARAMLTEPWLIVYNEILAGLSGGEKSAIIAAVLAFHREQPERTSLFMTANQETIKEIPLDSRIFMKGSSLHD
jgi:ABC-type transporter Mla maintaining outer membrane lipid asymmetry ATPase subunit MlaF